MYILNVYTCMYTLGHCSDDNPNPSNGDESFWKAKKAGPSPFEGASARDEANARVLLTKSTPEFCSLLLLFILPPPPAPSPSLVSSFARRSVFNQSTTPASPSRHSY